MSTEAGAAGEPPATGPPAPYAGRVTSGDAVTVNTRGVAVMDAEQKAADSLIADGVPAALMAKDPGLWGPDAAAGSGGQAGLADRAAQLAVTARFARHAGREVREDGLDHIVLAGTGGSALAPEVIGRSSGVALTVLDSTDPHEVAATLRDRLDSTLVVVSGKCGSTIETDSHRRIYERAFADLGLSPQQVARRFVVVTDPGSPLEKIADEAGYHVVLADPNVAGRYGALDAFGLVPAALAGADVTRLLDEAGSVGLRAGQHLGQSRARAGCRARRLHAGRARQGRAGRLQLRARRVRQLGRAAGRRVHRQGRPRNLARRGRK